MLLRQILGQNTPVCTSDFQNTSFTWTKSSQNIHKVHFLFVHRDVSEQKKIENLSTSKISPHQPDFLRDIDSTDFARILAADQIIR